MTKITQKEAVYLAVTSVLSEAGVTVGESESHSSHLNRELRAQVTNILVEGFKAGTTELDSPFETDAELRVYCSGLTSNWLRKDGRLNGGVKYSPKNPGSRVGSSDPQIKALRQLLSNAETEVDKAEVQGYITARLNEMGANKPKKSAQIDFSALPAELAAKYSA